MATKVFRDSTETVVGTVTTYNSNTGAVLSTLNTSFQRKIRGTADAVWHRKKPDDPLSLYPTPLSSLEESSNLGAYNGDRPYVGVYRQRFYNVRRSYDPAPTEEYDNRPSTSDQASVRLGAIDNFANGSLNLGESLVESRETISMIRKRAIQTYRILRAARKGNWKELQSALNGPVPGSLRGMSSSRRLASGHLEVQYGWLPLIGDIYGGIEHLHNRTEFSKDTYRKGQRRYFGDGGGDEYRGSFSASIVGKIGNPSVAELSRLGLTNPFLMAWNALPFSFLIDWFLPVSRYISTFHVNHGFTGVVGTTVQVRHWLQQSEGFGVITHRKYVTRSVWGSPGSFSLNTIALGNGITTRRALNALALLETLRPGRRRQSFANLYN